MDITTLIGLVASIAIVLGAILSGSDLVDFLNLPGLGIVCLGTLAVTLIKFPLRNIAGAFKLAFQTTFLDTTKPSFTLITELSELARRVRREGILGVDDYETDNLFLRKTLTLCVDGHPPEFVEEIMMQEVEQSMQRFDTAEKVFRGIGDSAPALGMLGTLVGLVQMLNDMDDPSSIGPAMAIALLTTFYGAFIAQLIALPLAEKIRLKAADEQRNMLLVLTSFQGVMRGQNPRLINDVMACYLDPDQRERLAKTLEKTASG